MYLRVNIAIYGGQTQQILSKKKAIRLDEISWNEQCQRQTIRSMGLVFTFFHSLAKIG